MKYEEFDKLRLDVIAEIERCYRDRASDDEFSAVTVREQALQAAARRYFVASARAFVSASVNTSTGQLVVSLTRRDESRFQERSVRWDQDSGDQMRRAGFTDHEIETGDFVHARFQAWIRGDEDELPIGVSQEEARRPWLDAAAR